MFSWIDQFYARLRPEMEPAQQRLLDLNKEHGGYGLIFGDCLEFAAGHDLITDDDRVHIKEILDYGLLRPAKSHFLELIAA